MKETLEEMYGYKGENIKIVFKRNVIYGFFFILIYTILTQFFENYTGEKSILGYVITFAIEVLFVAYFKSALHLFFFKYKTRVKNVVRIVAFIASFILAFICNKGIFNITILMISLFAIYTFLLVMQIVGGYIKDIIDVGAIVKEKSVRIKVADKKKKSRKLVCLKYTLICFALSLIAFLHNKMNTQTLVVALILDIIMCTIIGVIIGFIMSGGFLYLIGTKKHIHDK